MQGRRTHRKMIELKTILCKLLLFKSNVRETWRVILVSEADIFLSESLRILAERLSQSEIGLPLRQICYYSPPEEVGVFSTEISCRRRELPEAALAASQIIVVRISIIQ